MRLPHSVTVWSCLAALWCAPLAPWSHASEQAFPPPTLDVEHAGISHGLTLTGSDKRFVFIFRVYEIAHYLESSAVADLEPQDVVTDGPAKAIAIRFARNLGVELIRKEFKTSIRRNAEEGWLEAAAPTITAFMAAIDRDAQKGDQLVFFWLPGGQIRAEFNGEPAFRATDTTFAKLIWSIWFGADPVCDREELLASLHAERDA